MQNYVLLYFLKCTTFVSNNLVVTIHPTVQKKLTNIIRFLYTS